MRPFFSYYGAKWTVANHLGPPRRDLVIEPFAGSAAYSVRWDAPNVRLYDVSADVVSLWDWLIRCSARDVARIPDRFECIADVLALPLGASLLVRWWVSKGRAEPSGTLSPWYFQYRNDLDCKVWGPAVKARIIAQKPLIRGWSIDCLSFEKIPNVDAHWHVDPPYSGAPGRCYPHSDVDFAQLALWCCDRVGTVDVCENVGADWLPFEPLTQVVLSRGRRTGHTSHEAVCRLERERRMTGGGQ